MTPYLFAQLVKSVGAFTRAQGLSILQDLNNWNISAPTVQLCRLGPVATQIEQPGGLCCELIEGYRLNFVGISFHLIEGTVHPVQHRVCAHHIHTFTTTWNALQKVSWGHPMSHSVALRWYLYVLLPDWLIHWGGPVQGHPLWWLSIPPMLPRASTEPAWFRPDLKTWHLSVTWRATYTTGATYTTRKFLRVAKVSLGAQQARSCYFPLTLWRQQPLILLSFLCY